MGFTYGWHCRADRDKHALQRGREANGPPASPSPITREGRGKGSQSALSTQDETTIGIGTRFSVGATVPDFANADVLHVLHVLSYQSGTARVQINKHAYQPI